MMTTAVRRGPDRGFTLIEMVIVVSLIIVLAGIGMAQYRNGVIRAQEAVLHEDLFRMRDALDQYHADKQKYASSLEDLVTEGYLREVPKDPFTQSAETWQTVQAEPDASDPEAQTGIYNVKSGSERTALDGTKYSEW
jgi:general secretion pathway protein G